MKEYTIDKIWSIGGESGWYYGDWLWGIRGFIDNFGGVGSRRDRTNRHEIHSGTFWIFGGFCMPIKKKENSSCMPR
jgi:hypothetical protein